MSGSEKSDLRRINNALTSLLIHYHCAVVRAGWLWQCIDGSAATACPISCYRNREFACLDTDRYCPIVVIVRAGVVWMLGGDPCGRPGSSLLMVAYRNQGEVYSDLQDYEGAIKYYDRAIELDSEDVLVYNLRGNAYYYLKEYPKAIADYSRMIELDPEEQ